MTKGLQSRILGALVKPARRERAARGLPRWWQELGRAPYYPRIILTWRCQIKPDSSN
jgi:hypothetical protein